MFRRTPRPRLARPAAAGAGRGRAPAAAAAAGGSRVFSSCSPPAGPLRPLGGLWAGRAQARLGLPCAGPDWPCRASALAGPAGTASVAAAASAARAPRPLDWAASSPARSLSILGVLGGAATLTGRVRPKRDPAREDWTAPTTGYCTWRPKVGCRSESLAAIGRWHCAGYWYRPAPGTLHLFTGNQSSDSGVGPLTVFFSLEQTDSVLT